MSFRKNLSATAVASGAGMVLQAATAPAYLTVLTISQYSSWVLITSVGAYVALASNGVLYGIMNQITAAAHKGDREEASQIYNEGAWLVAFVCGLFCSALTTLYLVDPNSIVTSIIAALAISGINLTGVLFDANFRSMSRFAFGTNVLSAVRVLDWTATLLFLTITRDVFSSLILTLAYRGCAVFIMQVYVSRLPNALRLHSIDINPMIILGHVTRARGQLYLSATAAGIAMGPQIVIGTLFPGLPTVIFNVYRTYMRLLSSSVTVGTAAAWPILNKWYADQEFARIRLFMSRALVSAFALSTVCAAAMIFASPLVFGLLYAEKIEIRYNILAIVAASVIINATIIVAQSLYISTNTHSKALFFNAIICIVTLALMYLVGRRFGFEAAILVQLFGDICLLGTCLLAARGTLRRMGRGQTSLSSANQEKVA